VGEEDDELRAGRGRRGRLSGSEAGAYLRLINSCITQVKAQGPCRTCNASEEEEEAGIPGIAPGEELFELHGRHFAEGESGSGTQAGVARGLASTARHTSAGVQAPPGMGQQADVATLDSNVPGVGLSRLLPAARFPRGVGPGSREERWRENMRGVHGQQR
jgi:hypothetical protein